MITVFLAAAAGLESVENRDGSRLVAERVLETRVRCRPFFLSCHIFFHVAPLIYAETSLVLHFGKKFNKVSDKLLGQLLVLPADKLI